MGDPASLEHPVHASLVRPMLVLGVERHVIALEVTLCLALVFGVGVSLPTLALCTVVVLVLHPALVWITAKDSLATEVYLRNRGYADYYAPHGALHRPAGRPRVSVPGPR